MEMANTKKKPEYGYRMHNGNGRSDRYMRKLGSWEISGWSAMEIWNIRTYFGFFEELRKLRWKNLTFY